MFEYMTSEIFLEQLQQQHKTQMHYENFDQTNLYYPDYVNI
jgi:hypothetical protein